MRAVPDSIADRLESAAGVFASHGFDQTRLEVLAEVTGVPRATLYYYFPGKQEILAWLIRRTLTEISEAVGTAAGDGSAASRLEAIVTALLRTMSEHPETCTLIVGESGRIMRMPELADAVQEGFHLPVQRVLAEGETDGSLRPLESTETTSAVIWGAVFAAGVHYQVATGGIDPDKVGPQVLGLLLGGLAP